MVPSIAALRGEGECLKVPSYGWQAIMKIFVAAITIQGLIVSALIGSASGADPLSKKHIGLYEVNLVCPAARHIGCGSASKPILLQLESEPGVDEAWLNRAGTMVAVVWKEAGSTKQHAKVVRAVLKERSLREVSGKTREQTLKSFLSGIGWYRGAEVDRLSEEEAGIMAARLVRRIRALISLSDEKGKELQPAFTAALARKLTNKQSEDEGEIHGALFKICQDHLEEKDIVILKQAHENGAFSRLRED